MRCALRILVADRVSEARQVLQEQLSQLGHQVTLVETGQQMIALCLDLESDARPQLLVTDLHLPDTDGLKAAAEVNRQAPIPVLVITECPGADILGPVPADYLMGCLVKPARQADLETAIPLAVLRFERLQLLVNEGAALQQALADRKLLERAKGAVMKRMKVDEHEAYRHLHKRATEQNQKLTELASIILAAEEVFHALEQVGSDRYRMKITSQEFGHESSNQARKGERRQRGGGTSTSGRTRNRPERCHQSSDGIHRERERARAGREEGPSGDSSANAT